MNSRFTVVETSLNRAEFRWKWLRFLEYTSLLGSVLSFLALVFGGAILTGWITSKPAAIALFAVFASLGFIAFAVMSISIVAGAPDRSWLAAAVERVDRRLLDRLNTLLFLEKHRREQRTQSFAPRIAKQAQTIVAEKASSNPLFGYRPWPHLLGFTVLLMTTILFYQLYSPWNRLVAASKPKRPQPTQGEKPLELALPATNNVEQNQTWGEVRISDPGADLKVTKVDVVPLQVEAAANQPLKQVSWFSTVNGAGETPHELPPPTEPRYAVYQPTVYLDELRLSDWDVMTYYAKANTDKQNSYASEVYFLEVRPFREDILKMPGGEGGNAYQTLNEMSGLINRQQYIIRQTHQYVQKPPAQENLQAQDRKKLSGAEHDLSGSVQHLYAKMATEMENKPIGEALDSLAQAEQSLNAATSSLDKNTMPEAQNQERNALLQLVAARKMFQKTVSENPKAFEDPKDEEQTPVADASKKLNEIAEFRNEAKAAQDFAQKTLDKQKNLEQQARSAAPRDQPGLGNQEQQLQKALDDFQQQHPQAFKGTKAESQATRQAMAKAAQDLQSKRSDARQSTQQATQQLEKLNDALNNQSAGQQIADAYKLKKMLDKQIQTLDRRAQPDSKLPDSDVNKAAKEARQTLNELKKTAEQQPTRDAFGDPLRDALNGQNKVNLDAKLMQLQQAQDAQSKQQLAGEARDNLAKVSKAFDQSQPKALQTAKNNDSLKPNEQDSFAQGMSELDSLLKQLENHRKIDPKDQAKQGKQALFNLQTGMRSLQGDNDSGNQILLKLDQMLKAETPLEPGDLKKLMDQLQHFSVEASERFAKKEDKPEVTNIDPARLPPAYRGRIQKYFQKLSEE